MTPPSSPREPAETGRSPTSSSVLGQNAAFFAVLGVIALVLSLVSSGDRDPRLFLAALVVLGVTITAAVAVPWRHLPESAAMAVPVLGLLALGLICASGPRVALAGVLPVITLARGHGAAGVVVGVLGGAVVSWTDQTMRPTGITEDNFPRLLLLPVVLGVVAATIASVERRSRARASLLSRQDAELQQTVDELVSERALVTAMMESLPVGVVVVDADGSVVLVNPMVRRLTGRTVRVGDNAQYLGERSGPDAALDRLRDLARRHQGHGDAEATTEWWSMPDGSRRALRTTSVAFSSRSSEGALRVILIEDLTAEELANVEREDFIGSVSHELRTPLTSIIGHLELVADDESTTEAARRSLEIAERNADRLLHLVDDLLTAAALRTGTVELRPEPVDVGEIVAEAVFAAEPRAAAAGVALEVHGARGAVVDADRPSLGHLLDNVLSNAVKYSDPGGTVRITTTRAAGTVTVLVQDEGIGISEEDQAKLFRRFFRASAVRGTARHGTGLGLAISQQIVEMIGGSIQLRSRLGEGTTVEITLPALAGAGSGSGTTVRARAAGPGDGSIAEGAP